MFLSQPQYIGVEIGKTHFRFAILRKNTKGWAVLSLKEISKEDNAALFYKQFSEGVLVSSVHTRDALMRPCEIQLKKAKDIFAALDFHVEPLLPYPIDKAITQAQIISSQENATLLNVFAVQKERIKSHLETLKSYDLEPEIVTTRAHALAAFTSLLPQTNAPQLLVHEGDDEISLVLVEKGTLLAFRSIDNKKDWCSEIQKTLLSFSSTHKSKNFETLYFLGKDPELKNVLQVASGKPLTPLSSPYLTITQEELIQYGLCLGIALAHSGINFRQKQLCYPYPFRRLKKPLICFCAISILLAGSVWFLGDRALSQKQQAIHTTYLSLIKTQEISPSKNLQTPQDYLSSLHLFEKTLHAKPGSFPLLPQVPKVKEVLSWLTSIAQQGKESSVSIESLHYQMIKHPDFSHIDEKYKVRVELEISAKDPNAARHFQEALKNSHSLVDLNEELQWQFVKGRYKATFFLKDKTKYS